MDLSIGITTILRPACLFRLLNSLEGIEVEVFVADQNKEISNRYNDYDVQVLDMNYDAGVGKARNAIIDEIDTEYLMFLDDDIIADPSDIRGLYCTMKTNPEFGWVSPLFHLVERYVVVSSAANWEILDDTLSQVFQKPFPGDGLVEVDQPAAVGIFKTSIFDNVMWTEEIKIGREHLIFALDSKDESWEKGMFNSLYFEHGSCPQGKKYPEMRDRIEPADDYLKKEYGLVIKSNDHPAVEYSSIDDN